MNYNLPFGFIAAQAKGSEIDTSGGADGIRTRYLLNANQAFSRVNYGPTDYNFNLPERPLLGKPRQF